MFVTGRPDTTWGRSADLGASTAPVIPSGLRPRISAALSGAGFEIHSHSPELQALTRRAAASWSWTIKANQSGEQQLLLTLSATVDVDGGPVSLSPAIFERAIVVEVSAWQRVNQLIRGNMFNVVVGGLLVLMIAGGFRSLMHRRKYRDANADTPENSAGSSPSEMAKAGNKKLRNNDKLPE